ncbi:MAG: glycine--tRNA ligase [Candidatus Saccharimonadales bacterium]
MSNKEVKLEAIVSLAKRRGFVYQGSEVYGGLAGTWDYGPLGVALKRNIQNLWWKTFVDDRDDMYGVDAAILMNQRVWQASGHVETFTDPLVECSNCKGRFRADHLEGDVCPSCGENGTFGGTRQFNMMFKTTIGPLSASVEAEEYNTLEADLIFRDKNGDELPVKTPELSDVDSALLYNKNSVTYLRPETAQGIFTNYKNVVDSFYPDLPFGIAQIGKAFRNEISPRDFVFRSREFEQMEVEYFVHPDAWEEAFEQWRSDIHAFLTNLGLDPSAVHELEVPEDDRAHYSKRTIDFEFDFPHRRDELLGLAYRTDFDLGNIQRVSGKGMEYTVKGTNEKLIPHVIEPSFGMERMLMAILTSAYTEEEVNGEQRTVLKLPKHLAPVKIAVFPLLKNKQELVEKARSVYRQLRQEFGAVMWDDGGNIGKRYRKQDEIGTPQCVTVDFDTLEDDTVTVRDRDTMEQRRISISDLVAELTP